MAVIADGPQIQRIARFSLTTADAESAAQFYQSAFGCRRVSADRLAGTDFERLTGVSGGAARITLCLGHEVVELLQFDRPGAPYPRGSSASDLVFQHFAIVVADMRGAFQRLSAMAGWTAISTDGPQRLPASSGGVTAFKFRDPEGHPLELLAFPEGGGPNRPAISPDEPCVGIDHSAVAISDSAASVAYYQALGLHLAARSFNHGPAQERLDDVPGAEVDVVALAPPDPTPHLELLCYRGHGSASTRPPPRRKANDMADTRLVYAHSPVPGAADDAARSMRDPDGHALLIIAPGA
jgi:catechol 2,3-dioxygenase-like lactoylglutathione lyase family enzyme